MTTRGEAALDAPPGEELSAGHDLSASSARFWVNHMRIGFCLFAGECGFVMIYLATTPQGEGRALLWTLSAACALSALVAAAFARRVAPHSWRARFSFTWTFSAGVALAVAIHLDRGLTSPLVSLLWLPVVFAGIALGPLGAAVIALAGVSELAGVVVSTTAPPAAPGVLILDVAALTAAGVMAVTTSANRRRRQQAERALRERLAVLASTDGLTGCLNWRAFGERLAVEIAAATRYGQPLSLMMLDIDGFKEVNDRFGHPSGDAVLARMGALLRAECRAPDMVGRVGGDEFCVILPQTPATAARGLAERVIARLETIDDPVVTVSIGITELSKDRLTADRLLCSADAALYAVKGSGRNGIAIATELATDRAA